MKKVRFEWSRYKNIANFRNHGISFEEAKTVFYDENAIEFYDQGHSLGEDRYLIIGLSSKARLLLVSYIVYEKKMKMSSESYLLGSRQKTNKKSILRDSDEKRI
jgi:uncharacterized DUF497 family protein